MPDPFHAVGAWYGVFDPPSDDEVRDTLASWSRPWATFMRKETAKTRRT